MRTLFNRIILPLAVGAFMLGATWTVIGLSTGAWPAIFDLSNWPTDATSVAFVWLAVVSWALGCGPAYLLRRLFASWPPREPFEIEDEFGNRAILNPDGKGEHRVTLLD